MTQANRHRFVSELVDGKSFRHQIFFQLGSDRDRLLVFIEGDGTPWERDGSVPAKDPTPRRALALELATHTLGSVLYVGRPCYFFVQSAEDCPARLWTSDRYSERVVESMAEVVNNFVRAHSYSQTLLIGYSGGGALVFLMAPHVSSATAVVTIAANLDVQSWARWHDYLPLSGSLNPSTQPPLRAGIRQLHLIGGRDRNVPESVNKRFLAGLRPEELWRFPDFDHACCWVEQWPRILARIDAAADAR